MLVTGFADSLADRLQAEHAALAARWFERRRELLPVDSTEVFPTTSLLDHIPALIMDIGAYLRAPAAEAIAANTLVVEKARELGTLRHSQRASLHQLLREYQLLGGVLIVFVQDEIVRASLAPPPRECVDVISRLHQAVDVLMQETVETFVRLYMETISGQANRLEQFTRMASHEWRQPLGSLRVGLAILGQPGLGSEQFDRTLSVVQRNVSHLVEVTQKLERIARIDGRTDDPVRQEVAIGSVAQQAARQLQEMADARGVHIRIADDLPVLTVDVGRLELAFVNLLSNAIKYADANKALRFVDVLAGDQNDCDAQCIVRDNGIGIPADRLDSVFERFSRAHRGRLDLSSVPGMGLGLSIVADCVRGMGGHLDVQSTEGEGTSFVVTLPRTPISKSARPDAPELRRSPES
jgi:signal transduction histidine kinase